MADYAITAVERRVVYSGSAGTGPYSFSFPVLTSGDIKVYKDVALLTLTTDYTVTISSVNGTGSVTLGVAASASNTVTIVGARTIERASDFVTAGDLLASSLNTELDSQTIFVQQVSEESDRAIKAPVTDPTSIAMTLPVKADRLGKYLGFDGTTGDPIVADTVGDNKGNWAASTAYVLRDLVKDTSNNNVYLANTAHTSSGSQPISSNTDVAKWDLLVDSASATSSAAAAVVSAQLADDYAVKVSGAVTGSDYSSKSWSVGGTGVTTTGSRGAAKEWATTTGGAVDTSEYSAKEYALGTTVAAGSAKDWAVLAEDSAVTGSSYSALHHAAKGAASATAASSSQSAAATSATASAASASTSSTQATNSSNSATASASSATSSAASAASALVSAYGGLDYAYSTTTTDSDPGAGIIRLNHATLSSVTAAYLDDTDANSVDVSTYLLTWDDSSTSSNRGTLKMVKKGTQSTYALYNISGGSTDASGYVKLALTHIASNGTFSNADTVSIHQTRTGDTGSISAGAVDLNGAKLTLDADGDTSIHASTDDQIDIEIAGADDFRFAANTFSVLSGSTLNVDSGATIVNSGTATGFGGGTENAFSGVLQTNSNFVSQVIFGPSVDGVPWNGAWSEASVFSSLMLATIEDEGSNTEINIWDLTEQSAGAISTTPLATVDLANAAIPTSIAASMGYLIVGSEDGIAIIDPHSGAWAERTIGWPRTLSTSTTPALTDNDVLAVAAGFSDAPAYDPRTGGDMPCFLVAYGTGADVLSLIKDDGNVWDRSGTENNETGIGIFDGHIYGPRHTDARLCRSDNVISTIIADDWATDDVSLIDSSPQFLGIDTGLSFGNNNKIVAADAGGLSIGLRGTTQTAADYIWASITRAYNTGYLVGQIRGAWLANSESVDRSYNANTLTVNGTITEAAVESGCELLGYSGWTTSNKLTRASDADWDVITTGAVYMSIWVKSSGTAASESLLGFENSDSTIRCTMQLYTAGEVNWFLRGASAALNFSTTRAGLDDSVWHKLDCVQVADQDRHIYIDGVLQKSDTTQIGSLSDDGNLPLAIGQNAGATYSAPATSSTLALAHLSVTAPTATQVRQMYDSEKGMFVASAECLLQSGSTDAVLDVDVDPLTNKVLVTQTDAITIFDGLAIDSKPTVNSGASEKGELWGALRAEQNSANAYVTAPATDQRQVNEMVRGLASDLPAGVDLSKAKALLVFDQRTNVIVSSVNIKSVTDVSAGRMKVYFGIPFKNDSYVVAGSSKDTSYISTALSTGGIGGQFPDRIEQLRVQNSAGTNNDNLWDMVVFGELENE
jgi:hypothetical protein